VVAAGLVAAAEQEVAVGEGQLREAAILMVDIRGFTRLAAVIKPDECQKRTGRVIKGVEKPMDLVVLSE